MTDFNFREQSYWCRKGKYEKAVEKLDLIIDDQLIYDGPWKATMPKASGKNYHLERLRKQNMLTTVFIMMGTKVLS